MDPLSNSAWYPHLNMASPFHPPADIDHTSPDDLRHPTRISPSPYMRPASQDRDSSPTVSSSNSSVPPATGPARRAAPAHRHVKHRLRDIDRRNICLYHNQHPHVRQEDVAKHFEVERSTISKILKQKDKWLRLSPTADADMQTVRHRPSKFPDVDERMRVHLEMWAQRSVTISDHLIRTTALEIASEFGIDTDRFKASSGWVENFKTRNAIKRGEWARAPHPPVPPMPIPYDTHHEHHEQHHHEHAHDQHQHQQHQQNWAPDPAHVHAHASPIEPVPDPAVHHHQLPPITTGPPPATHIALSPSPDPAAIQHSPDMYDVQAPSHHVVHYPPRLPPDPSPIVPIGRNESHRPLPTAREADEAIDIVLRYIDCVAEPDTLESDESDALMKVKYTLFNTVVGIPYDRKNMPPPTPRKK